MEFNIWGISENLQRKFSCDLNLARKTGTFNEEVPICITISLRIPPRVRKVLDKRCRENQNKHFFNKILNKILSVMRECGTNKKYIVMFSLQNVTIYNTLPISFLNQYRVFLTLPVTVTERVTQDYEPVILWVLVNSCSTPSNIWD